MSTEKEKDDEIPNFTWEGLFAIIVLGIVLYFCIRYALHHPKV